MITIVKQRYIQMQIPQHYYTLIIRWDVYICSDRCCTGLNLRTVMVRDTLQIIKPRKVFERACYTTDPGDPGWGSNRSSLCRLTNCTSSSLACVDHAANHAWHQARIWGNSCWDPAATMATMNSAKTAMQCQKASRCAVTPVAYPAAQQVRWH